MAAQSQDEIFDVVDERDEVVGQAPRGEVHARGWRHRAVHVLVHDPHGRFFLQRRSPNKDTFPDCWDSSCSGHLDAGEDYLAAARRELAEEIGWRDATQRLGFLLKLEASPETGQEFIHVYLLGPLEGPFTLHPDEITEGRWFSPEEMSALLQASPEKIAGVLRLLWRNHRGLLTGRDEPRF